MWRVAYILAQMWEKGAPKTPKKNFGLPKGEKFSLPHVSMLKMLRFLWRIQTRKKFFDPLTDLQVGPWLLVHPSVTCHLSLAEVGVSRGGTTMAITALQVEGRVFCGLDGTPGWQMGDFACNSLLYCMELEYIIDMTGHGVQDCLAPNNPQLRIPYVTAQDMWDHVMWAPNPWGLLYRWFRFRARGCQPCNAKERYGGLQPLLGHDMALLSYLTRRLH